jgi:hypothetical protein
MTDLIVEAAYEKKKDVNASDARPCRLCKKGFGRTLLSVHQD